MLMGVTFVITYTAVSQHHGASEEAQQISQKTAELYAYLDHYFIGETDAAALSDAASSAMVDAIGDEWSYYIPPRIPAASGHAAKRLCRHRHHHHPGRRHRDIPHRHRHRRRPGIKRGAAGRRCHHRHRRSRRDGAFPCPSCGPSSGARRARPLLTYRRGDTETTCTPDPGNIETEVVHAQLLDGGIGYVRIVNFDGGCAEKTIAAIEDLQAQGATSIPFDVRNNPGGLKSELVDLLDYLLPEGEIFHTVDYAGNDEIDTSDEAHLALPMAVLVNRESYSAAEFFAAALQEYEAAVIVGTQTYGKGYFQSALQLSDGSAINLSIGKYFTPRARVWRASASRRISRSP